MELTTSRWDLRCENGFSTHQLYIELYCIYYIYRDSITNIGIWNHFKSLVLAKTWCVLGYHQQCVEVRSETPGMRNDPDTGVSQRVQHDFSIPSCPSRAGWLGNLVGNSFRDVTTKNGMNVDSTSQKWGVNHRFRHRFSHQTNGWSTVFVGTIFLKMSESKDFPLAIKKMEDN